MIYFNNFWNLLDVISNVFTLIMVAIWLSMLFDPFRIDFVA
jgi:hypothetical protein